MGNPAESENTENLRWVKKQRNQVFTVQTTL